MTKQVLQQALEALEKLNKDGWVLADFENMVYEAIEALHEALAQQGEPCDMGQMCLNCQPRGPNGECPDKAAPAAQPTCKQDLPVETEQERYVLMCPDIECGRKKRCTRMVGVSCMSRADIAPAAQPDDAIIRAWQAGYYHAGYTHDKAYADKMAREYAGAAPAAQPDARKVIEQMVGALKKARSFEEGGTALARVALAAGQKLLKELK